MQEPFKSLAYQLPLETFQVRLEFDGARPMVVQLSRLTLARENITENNLTDSRYGKHHRK